MKLNLKIFGLSQLLSRLTGVKDGLAKTLEEGMREAAFQVEKEAKLQLTSGPNRAIKTGYLRSSVGVASVRPYQAKVIANATYSGFVHDGTKFMRPRPFMAAGLQAALPEIEAIFGRRVSVLVETL